MTDNEKLIAFMKRVTPITHEPLAQHVAEEWATKFVQEFPEFEATHAPTDDEREALLDEADALVASWDQKGSWSSDSPVGMVMRLAAALRRSEVPEPSAPARITIEHEDGNTVTGTLEQVLNHGHLKPGWTYREADVTEDPAAVVVNILIDAFYSRRNTSAGDWAKHWAAKIRVQGTS